MMFLCRDCASMPSCGQACTACGSARVVGHPELTTLSVAHVDCDAFYASIEQRDDPRLRGCPVVVGGSSDRGVVAACSYEARRFGIRSAMPIVQARKLCPDAIFVSPDMEKYHAASERLRNVFLSMTPLVEPVSLDEAYLDFAGTEKYHARPAAAVLAEAALRIEREERITVSVGLSYNKGLAKIASDLDKPRGFSVIGRAEAIVFLRSRPPSIINGVGPVLTRRLREDGIVTIGQIQDMDERDLMRRYGQAGMMLARFARGEDPRRVETDRPTRSISSETTFDADIHDFRELSRHLRILCEKVSRRLKDEGFAGRTAVLKLKTSDHRSFSRNKALSEPTQLAGRMFEAVVPILKKEADGRSFRLIGIGAADLGPPAEADQPDLFDDRHGKTGQMESAVEQLRRKLGDSAIFRASDLPRK